MNTRIIDFNATNRSPILKDSVKYEITERREVLYAIHGIGYIYLIVLELEYKITV